MRIRDYKVLIAGVITVISLYTTIGLFSLPSPPPKEPVPFFVETILLPVAAYAAIGLFAGPILAWRWALDED